MRRFSKRVPTLFLTLALCALALSGTVDVRPAAAQNLTDARLVAYAEQISGDRFPLRTRTARGVRVFARNTPRPETLRAIDDGFAELFQIARRHRYTRRLSYSDYTVFIARADRTQDSSRMYSPDVAVPAGQYAGSGYDQGGFIYAAGMVLAFNPSSFVIAEHERDWQRISNIVRYEGEHLVLYYNDRRLFDQTADHSTGGFHPILK